jgi:hypothetical protein
MTTPAELKALRIPLPHFCLTMPRIVDRSVKSPDDDPAARGRHKTYANPPGLVVTWIKITHAGKREMAGVS